MRNIIVLGGSESSGIANRLAAELASQNVRIHLAEGPEQALALAEQLGAEEVDREQAKAELDAGRVLLIGAGFAGHGLRNLAEELDRFTVAPELHIERPKPSQLFSPYWHQGNQKFDRKQQGMKAKARRR